MEMRNIHHYEFPGYTPSTTELQEAVDAVDTAYKSNLQAQLVNDVQVYGYDVRRVDIGDQPTAEYNATAGDWVGSSAVDPLPPQLCAMVTWKAFSAYPRSTRSYLFPFNEGSSDGLGQVASGTFDLIDDFALDMITLSITGQTDASKVAVQYGATRGLLPIVIRLLLETSQTSGELSAVAPMA